MSRNDLGVSTWFSSRKYRRSRRPVEEWQQSRVLSQHAEGASFLWILRNGAVVAPHYGLADLAKLDQRVQANLEGLRIAGEGGWEICKEALSAKGPGEVFAAAVLAFESGDNDRLETVFEVGAAPQECSRGLASALGWLTFQ